MKLTKQKSLCATLWLGTSLACMVLSGTARAQGFTTTTVQGTVYLANGHPGSGSLQVSWPTFTTANNQAVAAGRMNVTIGADGYVSVNLAANLGATPAGLYYTAVYHLSDGTTSTEYWVVPAAAQASLSQVRAQVMPAAQAVQAVSKAYVDQSVQELTQSLLTASGGSLSGPLFLNGDPSQPTQAASKHYVDTEFGMAVPMSGGALTGPLTSVQLGAAYQVDQFPGADFGAKLQACVNMLNATYGGTCDARNFSGNLVISSILIIGKANATVQLPCATISTSSRINIPGGTRNVTLHGCALRGASASSGSAGGTVFLYSGTGAMMQVGDPTYAVDTSGFHIDNAVINTTGSSSSTAEGLAAYRTQEMNLASLYFLGNSNQTGITLDGTGNYTGGTFQDIELGGFGMAVNAVGHQAASMMTTDWLNASTFLRLHIDCPTNGGTPIAGTYGINLQQGDGNTFTGGDVEGCSTALHLGPNAQNNTIVGLRNENSTNQVVADAGSSYNNWITGGTMFTGQLTDNGTRNSFLDTFHRSFNGLNGDWYGSQQDATVTNHFRLGTGNGNERGLLNRYQTDSGYRWTTGFSDATAGEQFYQVLDELNNVYRLSMGQYNNGQSSSNNQTVINAAGSGAVVLNGSSNSGTGGILFGSGGASAATVASINNAGNAQFNGTLQVGGPSTFTNSTTVKNQVDAEIDSFLWAGATANQKESYTYKDYTGTSQWYMVKDASNNWALNSATGGLDSFKAYQSSNSGDTYINASNPTGHIRLNYETGSGAETDIYSGASSGLVAAFLGSTAIKFPGLAAASGRNCLQIDNSGYISNSGSGCGSSQNGIVNTGNAGQVAYYTGNGNAIAGMNAVAVNAGGTGASSATQALQNLGAQAAITGLSSDGASGVAVNGNVAAGAIGNIFYASRYPGQSNNGVALTAADSTRCGINGCMVVADPGYGNTEKPSTAALSATPLHYEDLRNGMEVDYFRNPGSDSTGNPAYMNWFNSYGEVGKNVTCQYDLAFTASTGGNVRPNCLELYMTEMNPGVSIGNNAIGPTAWQASGALNINHTAYNSGITESITINQNKTGTGDNPAIAIYLYGQGGMTAASDEQNKDLDLGVAEQPTAFAGQATNGPYTNPTSVTTTAVVGGGLQGVGRMAIYRGHCTSYPTNCPVAPYTGKVTAIAAGLQTQTSALTVSGTVPVSNAWGTLTQNCNTGLYNPIPPNTTTVTCTVNVTSGTLDTTHLICFSSMFHDCAVPTAAGGGSITIALRHQHANGSYWFQGGMAGYGFEFTAYTQTAAGQTQPLRYVYDVFGSTGANTVQVGRFVTSSTVAISQNSSVYAFANLATTLSSSGTTISGTFVPAGSTLAANTYPNTTVVISGSDGGVLDGLCTGMTWTTNYNFTCTNSGLTGTHTNVTNTPIAKLTGNGVTLDTYNLWPMAEVLDVRDTTVNPPVVNGKLALEPNIFGTVSNGDIIEETHHISASFQNQSSASAVYNPYTTSFDVYSQFAFGAGVSGGGAGMPANAMFRMSNYNPDNMYNFGGGFLTPPNEFSISGAYYNFMNLDHIPSPSGSIFYVNPQTIQANDPNLTYGFFQLFNRTGSTSLTVNPYTGNTAYQTGGTATWSATSHTFAGKVVTPATATGGAGFNLPHGTAPSSPANGDCWTTTVGLFCQVNGGTVGPYGTVSTVSSQVGTVASGGLSNYIKNSATMAGTGWATAANATATAGQADPFGGTNAVQIVTTSASSATYINSGATATNTAQYTACGYYKGAAGTERETISIGSGGGIITGLLSTSWTYYTYTLTSGSNTANTVTFTPNGAQTVYLYGWSIVPLGTPCLSPGLPTGNYSQATAVQEVSTPVVSPNGPQTTVSCSTSGSAVFSQPFQGTSDKRVVIHLAACSGAATYNFPVAFTNMPGIFPSSTVAAGLVTSLSASATTVTGSTSTGTIVLEDY